MAADLRLGSPLREEFREYAVPTGKGLVVQRWARPSSRAAVELTLGLHELATNGARCGALPSGRVDLRLEASGVECDIIASMASVREQAL